MNFIEKLCKKITNNIFFSTKDKKKYSFFNENFNRLAITLILLIFLRIGNLIPLHGIDHLTLKKNVLQNQNIIFNFLNFYNLSDAPLITPFSLGLGPYINASIIIDLLTVVIPSLEKFQMEEGDNGKKKILFYKKILSFFFAAVQSSYLIFNLYPFLYETSIYNILSLIWVLILGSLITIWSSNLIDEKGFGNGTSLIIFSTLIIILLQSLSKMNFWITYKNLLDINFLIIFSYFIFLLQQKTYIIDVISARQLSLFENNISFYKQPKILSDIDLQNGLLIKLNQAGIFPLIITTNIFPILTYFFQFSFLNFFNNFFYYLLIIIFNYFYTIFFWNPKKITGELIKYSVSIFNIPPGIQTQAYLEKIVFFTSLLGGFYLCLLLIFYELVKFYTNTTVLQQINISSLIILIGIASEFQKKLKILNLNSKYKKEQTN